MVPVRGRFDPPIDDRFIDSRVLGSDIGLPVWRRRILSRPTVAARPAVRRGAVPSDTLGRPIGEAARDPNRQGKRHPPRDPQRSHEMIWCLHSTDVANRVQDSQSINGTMTRVRLRSQCRSAAHGDSVFQTPTRVRSNEVTRGARLEPMGSHPGENGAPHERIVAHPDDPNAAPRPAPVAPSPPRSFADAKGSLHNHH